MLAEDDYADFGVLFRQTELPCRGDVLTGQILLAKGGPARSALQ